MQTITLYRYTRSDGGVTVSTGIVKSVSGMTVQQHVFKAIVRQSIFLINNTDKSVKQISDLLNFPNPSAFGTFFKKHTGLSPRHFRKENIGKTKQ